MKLFAQIILYVVHHNSAQALSFLNLKFYIYLDLMPLELNYRSHLHKTRIAAAFSGCTAVERLMDVGFEVSTGIMGSMALPVNLLF